MYFPESKDAAGPEQAFFILFTCGRRYQARTRGSIAMDRLGNATELNEGKPKFLKARGSIKRSPIVENSLCPFSPMQHWSVYLTMYTNLFDILLNEQYQFVLIVRLQSDPVGRRLGQYCQMSDGLFSISTKGYFKKY